MVSDQPYTQSAELALPRLTEAKAPLTCEIDTVNEHGESVKVSIPAERALTVYVDKRELVTLMTLGAHPELLVLGYLRNQRLLRHVEDVESITVDWEVGAAAVKTRHGIEKLEEKTAQRVVTTGCGQGSIFGGLMDEVDTLVLPLDVSITQGQLYALVNTIRLKESTYKSAGSVHACALFDISSAQASMLLFIEDVGRHNAIDTIAGWMWMNMAPRPVASPTAPDEPAQDAQALRAVQSRAGGLGAAALTPGGALRPRSGNADLVAAAGAGAIVTTSVSDREIPSPSLAFYTTGRLTSEMVIKSAQMGVPIVVSRSGITQMGHSVAQQVGLCAVGRATNKRFLCYSAPHRLLLEPGLAGVSPTSDHE